MSTYYVATTGNNSAAGTATAPWATIQQAANTVKPGDTVIVEPGTYNITSSITTNTNGTTSAPITFESAPQWGAKIVGTGTQDLWVNVGNHINIQGFDITGDSNAWIGILNNGSSCNMTGNRVHDMPATGAGDNGGAGIDNWGNGTSKSNNIIGNWIFNIGTVGVNQEGTVHGICLSSYGGMVSNNIIYDCQGWGIATWNNAQGATISNNLVWGNGFGAILIGAGGDGATTGAGENFIVTNNIILYNTNNNGDSGYSIEESNDYTNADDTNNVYSNNLCYGNLNDDYTNEVSENTAVPLMVNPMLANFQIDGTGNYHLTSGSSCINAGTSNGSYPTDYDGNARPQSRSTGSGYDIGPYEYVTVYYVAPNGSDLASGSITEPWATIQQAANTVIAGDTVYVAPGKYTLPADGINTTTSGTAGAPITFISTVKWGAQLYNPGGAQEQQVWLNSGNYVTIQGFDMSGNGTNQDCLAGILNMGGSYCQFIGNYIHDITIPNGLTSGGEAGICSYACGQIAGHDIIAGNLVARIGSPGGGNLWHGIYEDGLYAIIANNICVSNMSCGITDGHYSTNMQIVNNSCIANGVAGIWIGGDDVTVEDYDVVANNICAYSPWGIYEDSDIGDDGAIGFHNQYLNNCVYGNSDGGISQQSGDLYPVSGTVTRNPQFVNYQSNGTGNYQLASGSSCIGAGTSTDMPPTDFLGVIRPAGGPYDIGAYQYQVNNATINVTGYDVTYTGTAHSATATATGVNGINLASDLTIYSIHTNAGTYIDSWSFTDPSGYYAPASGTMTDTIVPAALTVSANNETMVRGNPVPALTVSYNGFVDGQTVSNLTVQPTATTTATSESLPGQYAIAVAGAVDPNYIIGYVPAIMTVTKKLGSIG